MGAARVVMGLAIAAMAFLAISTAGLAVVAAIKIFN